MNLQEFVEESLGLDTEELKMLNALMDEYDVDISKDDVRDAIGIAFSEDVDFSEALYNGYVCPRIIEAICEKYNLDESDFSYDTWNMRFNFIDDHFRTTKEFEEVLELYKDEE